MISEIDTSSVVDETESDYNRSRVTKIISTVKGNVLVKLKTSISNSHWLLPLDALQARPTLSCGVCLSVCLPRSYILYKRINISSKFFHCRVATPF